MANLVVLSTFLDVNDAMCIRNDGDCVTKSAKCSSSVSARARSQ